MLMSEQLKMACFCAKQTIWKPVESITPSCTAAVLDHSGVPDYAAQVRATLTATFQLVRTSEYFSLSNCFLAPRRPCKQVQQILAIAIIAASAARLRMLPLLFARESDTTGVRIAKVRPKTSVAEI